MRNSIKIGITNRLALVVMYTHVEGYPPSLNAIQLLSGVFDRLVILHRHTLTTTWIFPPMVELVLSGRYQNYAEVKIKPAWWKAGSFFKFAWRLIRLLQSRHPEWLIIHEPVALLAWWITRPFYRQPVKVWYHNHDVIVGNESFLFRLAYRAQQRAFCHLHVFSLPAEERRVYFPMGELRGAYFYIPNFPGRYLYDRYYRPRKLGSEIRAVYQGHIGSGHGLLEMLEMMAGAGIGRRVTLVLKGFRDEKFFTSLMARAHELTVAGRVEYHPVSSYQSVPEIASRCHFGIGIHTKNDIMNSTLGSASNKIYEYAALGLPVLLFDNSHFRQHLGRNIWALFCDGTAKEIERTLNMAEVNYESFSLAARKSFEENLNFEIAFEKALNFVK